MVCGDKCDIQDGKSKWKKALPCAALLPRPVNPVVLFMWSVVYRVFPQCQYQKWRRMGWWGVREPVIPFGAMLYPGLCRQSQTPYRPKIADESQIFCVINWKCSSSRYFFCMVESRSLSLERFVAVDWILKGLPGRIWPAWERYRWLVFPVIIVSILIFCEFFFNFYTA
jgi:hypothetical protein